MKNLFFDIRMLVILLVAGLTFTACSSDNDVTEDTPVTPPTPAPATYTMTVEANKGNDNASARGFRALAENGDGTLTATWTAGDVVTVWKENNQIGTLTAQSSGASTKLTGTLTTAPSVNDELTLKYLSPNYSSQDGTLTGTDKSIDKTCDYATATVTVATVSDNRITTTAAAEFVSQSAFVKFTLKDSGNNGINASPLTISVGGSTYTITPASARSELYVALPPLSNETMRLVATVNGNTYVYLKTNVTFEANKYYTRGIKMKNPTYPIALSALSSSDYIGSIIGSDGNIYATVADAGDKARAAIAYVGSASNCTKCLAIALNDASTGATWSTATSVNDYAKNHKINEDQTKWRLPSLKDWCYIFKGLGDSSNPESFNPKPDDPSENEYGNGKVLRNAINTICANTDLGLAGYWSSTTINDNQAWGYTFSNSAFFSENKTSEQPSVRYVYAY